MSAPRPYERSEAIHRAPRRGGHGLLVDRNERGFGAQPSAGLVRTVIDGATTDVQAAPR